MRRLEFGKVIWSLLEQFGESLTRLEWVVQPFEMTFDACDENGDIVVCVLTIFIAIEGNFVDEVTDLCSEGGACREARSGLEISILFQLSK